MFKLNPGEVIGVKVEKKEDIKIGESGDTIVVEAPLCFRDPTTREIKCTGKYIAKYKKGVVGPIEVTIVKE